MKNSFRLLVIDDSPDVHHDFIKILTNLDAHHSLSNTELEQGSELPVFLVDCVLHGAEGLKKVKEAKADNLPYALVFVDMPKPPGMDGLETIRKIWEIDQDIQVVICTAYADYSWEETVKLLGIHDNLLILKKPFEPVTVGQMACALAKKWWLDVHAHSADELVQKLEHQATHDSLTGLPNRVLLIDRINQSIAVSTRQNKHFALLFFDLDRFKLINDSFSHESGDQLLCDVARRLSSLVREEDTLARLGGDEFIMIIPSLERPEDVITVAQKIINSFNEPYRIGDKKLSLSASIGIALFPEDGPNAGQLLRNADLGMYYAKELGGNQFRFYTSSLNQKSLLRLRQEKELHNALLNKEFFLVYQPQYDGNTQKIHAVEALLRWKHPEKGILLPIDFIPVAEESGLIVPIGEWVIEQIAKQFKEWQVLAGKSIHIAINISVQQLRHYNLAGFIKTTLERYDMPTRCLEIEIMEHVLVRHPDVRFMLDALKELGVSLILDNFGTESISLNYLKEMQIDGLKIDQSFIQNVTLNAAENSVVEAIIAMGKNFHFKVMAEGVETKRQWSFLKQYQCDRMQGFYLSKPLTAELISHLIFK